MCIYVYIHKYAHIFERLWKEIKVQFSGLVKETLLFLPQTALGCLIKQIIPFEGTVMIGILQCDTWMSAGLIEGPCLHCCLFVIILPQVGNLGHSLPINRPINPGQLEFHRQCSYRAKVMKHDIYMRIYHMHSSICLRASFVRERDMRK